MKTLLERSLRLIDPRKARTESVQVRLYDGKTLVCKPMARPCRRAVETSGIDGASISVAGQDFIVAIDELPIVGNKRLEPQRGWKLEWDRVGHTDVFELLPDDDGPVFEPADSYGVLYRIHTKRTGEKPLS